MLEATQRPQHLAALLLLCPSGLEPEASATLPVVTVVGIDVASGTDVAEGGRAATKVDSHSIFAWLVARPL